MESLVSPEELEKRMHGGISTGKITVFISWQFSLGLTVTL